MRARRAAVLLVGLTLVTPALVGGTKEDNTRDVTDAARKASVHSIDTEPHISSIALAESVEPLKQEDIEGSTTTVTISADVLFDFDEATLGDRAVNSLKDISDDLSGVSGTVQVVGHSDGLGEESYNQELSEKRAKAVKKALEDALGSDAPDIEASGKGSEDPVAKETDDDGNDKPAARAKNRRVEISYEGA